MTARLISRPDAVSAASQEVEGSDLDNHNLAEGRCNLCGKCTKVVGDLKPSTPNERLDFGVDGEGYSVNWDVAKVKDSAKRCDLCRLLVEMFHLDQPKNAVSSGTIDGSLIPLGEHYTLATDPPSGPDTLDAASASRLLSQMLQPIRRIWSPKPSAPTSQRSLWRPDVRDKGNWSLVSAEINGKFKEGYPKTYSSWTLGRQLVMSYNGRWPQEVLWESENGPASSKAEDGKEEPSGIQKGGVQEAGATVGETEEVAARARKEKDLFEVAIHQPEIFNSIQMARFNSSRSDPESAFFVRQISSRRQNIPLIRSWLDRCLRGHKGGCRLSLGGPNIRSLSIRVIDVEARCVVKAPRRCRYLALSYVWGNAKQVLLKTTNEKAFSRPGGLPDGIPATIEDAMALCRMLGERYLWVDALCIYQDPPPENPGTGVEFRATVAAQSFQQLQIRNMDAIFSSAILTIVNAAASSADDPISGVRSDAPCRVPLPSVEIGKNLQVAVTIADAWGPVSSHSKWDTRGWTFQEKILSKRLLVVTEYFSFFRCPSMLWREDRFEADLFKETAREKAQIWESGDVRGLHYPTPRSKSQEPAQKTLDVYQKLVQIYTTRNFTHDKDVLLAFQGIEKAMEPSVGEFFWGLPKRGFNAALTWAFTGQSRRREDFPSWSWAGWKGPNGLEFMSDISKRVDVRGGRIPFYQLIARRRVRRTRGEPPLSLADEDVDVCIINKSWLGDEEDHIAGAFRTTEIIMVLRLGVRLGESVVHPGKPSLRS
ncbi:hypothetical protein EPUS_05924 [Endocarpon pusillum Z07020]|uniref:Heterokaryon incompatibility domain-containing protein n=1 Tax=Endocarpon pusillum (strain Z07020 / HMAS-L-300199) TaxID=1263415 RepID=U1G8W7_ENDPU|nr:uncharacterized protein EPUS_05924 [Endocarpon pusillum Z07020]ERF73912.1 hypothetical protein EPUS_05924 [Endocarpon pusillum Z07020]